MPMEKKNWSRFRVVLTKEMQGQNMPLHRAIKIYLFILPRNEGLPQKIQTEHTDALNQI